MRQPFLFWVFLLAGSAFAEEPKLPSQCNPVREYLQQVNAYNAEKKALSDCSTIVSKLNIFDKDVAARIKTARVTLDTNDSSYGQNGTIASSAETYRQASDKSHSLSRSLAAGAKLYQNMVSRAAARIKALQKEGADFGKVNAPASALNQSATDVFIALKKRADTKRKTLADLSDRLETQSLNLDQLAKGTKESSHGLGTLKEKPEGWGVADPIAKGDKKPGGWGVADPIVNGKAKEDKTGDAGAEKNPNKDPAVEATSDSGDSKTPDKDSDASTDDNAGKGDTKAPAQKPDQPKTVTTNGGGGNGDDGSSGTGISKNLLIGLGGAAIIGAGVVGGLYWVTQKAVDKANTDAQARILQAQGAANDVITHAETAAAHIIQLAQGSVNQIIANVQQAGEQIVGQALTDVNGLINRLTAELAADFPTLTTAGLQKFYAELQAMFQTLISNAGNAGNLGLQSSLQKTWSSVYSQFSAEYARRGLPVPLSTISGGKPGAPATSTGTSTATATSR